MMKPGQGSISRLLVKTNMLYIRNYKSFSNEKFLWLVYFQDFKMSAYPAREIILIEQDNLADDYLLATLLDLYQGD